MENNSVDPAAIPKATPRDAKRNTGVTPNSLNQPNQLNKLEKTEDVKANLETTDASALMAEKRLVASDNLEMIRERLKEIAESLNKEMQLRAKDLKFSVDEITNRFLVTVLEKDSGKVVKQIPSDAILKVAHNLEALKGILFDDRY